jgi:hypothetical protein
MLENFDLLSWLGAGAASIFFCAAPYLHENCPVFATLVVVVGLYFLFLALINTLRAEDKFFNFFAFQYHQNDNFYHKTAYIFGRIWIIFSETDPCQNFTVRRKELLLPVALVSSHRKYCTILFYNITMPQYTIFVSCFVDIF